MASYQALEIHRTVEWAHTHCVIVNLHHRGEHRRGASAFAVGVVAIHPTFSLRLALHDLERSGMEAQLQWMAAATSQDGVCRALSVVRFFSPTGVLANLLFVPVVYEQRWPAIPGWAEFLS